MNKWYVLGLAAIPLLLSFARSPQEPEFLWWTTHALDKVRPYDPAPRELNHAVKLKAARNEFEPFQVVFRAQGQDFSAIDVDVTDLRGPSGSIPANAFITVYLEQYLDLKTPSSIEGGTGEWPDPLIPRIDRYSHERRNAFPFKIAKDRNQPVWVDVYVPPGTAAGIYHGEVLVTVGGKRTASIPIDLEVWNFDLNSTSTLVNTFGFSGLTAVRRHFGKYTTDKAVADITSLYEKSALWHRITLDGSSGMPPRLSVHDGKVEIHWDEYDAQATPFMEGQVFTKGEPLFGAKATSTTLHPPPSLTDPEQQVEYWREVAKHFRQKGWMDRLFIYLWDEPKPFQYSKMAELGRTIRRADPELKNLVTAPLHRDWADFIDIWTPTINCLAHRPKHLDYCDDTIEPAGYHEELGHGKRLWWYQACGTHGCNIVGGEYFTGWPSYVIDSEGIRQRVMEWLTWKNGITGELYFSTNESYSQKGKDPWKDVYLFGGNGDGTLYYPGLPSVVGGTTHIPIESIRLKVIREGFEDYEYLALLAKLGGSTAATDAVNSFVRQMYDFDSKPEKLYAARELLASEILRRVAH